LVRREKPKGKNKGKETFGRRKDSRAGGEHERGGGERGVREGYLGDFRIKRYAGGKLGGRKSGTGKV